MYLPQVSNTIQTRRTQFGVEPPHIGARCAGFLRLSKPFEGGRTAPSRDIKERPTQGPGTIAFGRAVGDFSQGESLM